MKALTVQQPWAWAIINGGKLIENRTQLWSYRGPLAIHAGKRWSEHGEYSPLIREASQGRSLVGALEMGAIIGTVDLVDAHHDVGCCKPWGESGYVEHGGRSRKQIVHYVFENPVPLSCAIECKGALGLWNIPADVLDEMRLTREYL